MQRTIIVDAMQTARTCPMSIVLLAALALGMAPSASAQRDVMIEYRGKQIACSTSGLFSFEMSCGIDSWYEDIFIGSVQSVTEISETERVVRIVPGEVFLGNPGSLLTVTTSQGACLAELKAGDDWLFYLRRDKKSKELLLEYGSPSGPVADTEETISLLRRLACHY